MTLANLYQKALEKLQAVAAGEVAAAEDSQLIASKYVSVWNQLKIHGLVSWAVDEAVPDEAVEPLLSCLAFASADEFGAKAADFAAAGAIGMPQPSLAERQLRVLHARGYVATPARPSYF
jgi:hypothetical protein